MSRLAIGPWIKLRLDGIFCDSAEGVNQYRPYDRRAIAQCAEVQRGNSKSRTTVFIPGMDCAG
jgi:hypothetical protein